jgi:hypothetical protein
MTVTFQDNSEITHESKKTASHSQLSGVSIWSQPLCIEISLKTTEGEGLVLETWVLSLREGADSSIRYKFHQQYCNKKTKTH